MEPKISDLKDAVQTFYLLELNLQCKTVKSERSLASDIILLPLINIFARLIMNMLSIAVDELLYTRVGLSMLGIIEQLCKVYMKLCA